MPHSSANGGLHNHRPNALQLLLTHGRPGSVIEFLDATGPLTDPVAHKRLGAGGRGHRDAHPGGGPIEQVAGLDGEVR
ncbi:hypothetical protein GCM10029976_072420 [Kribbella albertanoniae]|uniref:Uncharacterized protein n=1 Tax=Kribbella albertanoniae TaxID=1266829 RepID=A0A4R4PNZ3_9ACTN|nr:hypothetical protein [Kribbella albertanoniae]TDC23876.1 hypothetical protein E1261_27490 [Kribbella albertanoniae]